MAIVQLGSLRLQVERKESRREFVEGLIGQINEQVRWIVARCIEEALEAEVTSLLGREWYERRQPPGEQTAAQCNRCGSRDAQDFRRDGHYSRYLNTAWGRLKIRVPQLECVCEGSVKIPFQTLRSRQRIWDDLEGEIRERYGWGMSLRWIKACLDARLKSSVGLRTLNERVRQMAQLVDPWRQRRLTDVPPVVRVDGIWITLMTETGEVKRDRLGRERAVKKGQKVPILVAQGVWPVFWTAGSDRLGTGECRGRGELGGAVNPDVGARNNSRAGIPPAGGGWICRVGASPANRLLGRAFSALRLPQAAQHLAGHHRARPSGGRSSPSVQATLHPRCRSHMVRSR